MNACQNKHIFVSGIGFLKTLSSCVKTEKNRVVVVWSIFKPFCIKINLLAYSIAHLHEMKRSMMYFVKTTHFKFNTSSVQRPYKVSKIRLFYVKVWSLEITEHYRSLKIADVDKSTVVSFILRAFNFGQSPWATFSRGLKFAHLYYSRFWMVCFRSGLILDFS